MSDLHRQSADAARSRAARAALLQRRAGRRLPGAHRGEPGGAQRLRHRDRASRRWRRPRAADRAARGRRRRAAHRRADRAQGPVLHAGCAHHLRLAHARQLRLALRCDGGREAEGRGRDHRSARPTWTSSPWAPPTRPASTARCAIPGTRRWCPAAPRAARRRRSPRAWCRAPPAPTPVARSASPPRCAASPA